MDVHVLDHHGNLLDACFLSALAAISVFRKPETTVSGGEGEKVKVVVHPPEVKEPIPLSIQLLPVSVTFGLFEVCNLTCFYELQCTNQGTDQLQRNTSAIWLSGLQCTYQTELLL